MFSVVLGAMNVLTRCHAMSAVQYCELCAFRFGQFVLHRGAGKAFSTKHHSGDLHLGRFHCSSLHCSVAIWVNYNSA